MDQLFHVLVVDLNYIPVVLLSRSLLRRLRISQRHLLRFGYGLGFSRFGR